MRFAIEGQIDNVGAADIFLFMGQTQRTSVVAFERPEQETRVFFVDGQPVWCLSTKVQLQLEARLSSGGVVKVRDIETALARQCAGSGRIAQSLLAELMATEASIETDLRALALDSLRDVATWTKGTFIVYDGVIPPPWAFTITPNFPALLMEALRGQCQKDVLQKEFLARRGILRARSIPRTSSELNGAETAVLRLVDGERTIEELIKKSGLDEQTALGAMHVLCALHLADLLPPRRGSKPTADKATAVGPPPVAPPQEARRNEAERDDRGGATDRFLPQPPLGPPAPLPKASGTPERSEPRAATDDSTTKLPAVQMLRPHAAPKAGPATCTLRVVSEDKTEDIPLNVTTFAIGRHPKNDLVLKDPRISSFHCRVELQSDKYVILDLKSRNGTLLNSARVDRAVLKHNDRIQLGSTKVSFIES